MRRTGNARGFFRIALSVQLWRAQVAIWHRAQNSDTAQLAVQVDDRKTGTCALHIHIAHASGAVPHTASPLNQWAHGQKTIEPQLGDGGGCGGVHHVEPDFGRRSPLLGALRV